MDLSRRVLRRERRGVATPLPTLADPPVTAGRMWPYYARRVVVNRIAFEASLRLMGSRTLSGSPFARYLAHGLDINDVSEAISHVRGLRGWVANWRAVADGRTAQGDALLAGGNTVSAARCFFYASLSYHFAQVALFGDAKLKEELSLLSYAAYAKAAPHFDPPAERVSIPFPGHDLPGYLRLPRGVSQPPVVVNMNGVSMTKEEFFSWEEEMLARGVATLSFDGPGSGESWYAGLTMVADYQQVSRAVLDFLAARPDLDGTRVGLMGVSLGGYLALWMAAASDPRYRALVTLCAPYNLAREYRVVMPLVRHEIQFLFNFDHKRLRQMLRQPAAQGGLAKQVQIPTLVIAGGQDMIVPPRNSRQIYDDLPGEKEMLYFANSGHACYNYIADVRMAAADWFVKHLAH